MTLRVYFGSAGEKAESQIATVATALSKCHFWYAMCVSSSLFRNSLYAIFVTLKTQEKNSSKADNQGSWCQISSSRGDYTKE